MLSVLDFLETIYGIIGFKFQHVLSTRNLDTMIGRSEVWDKSEAALEEVLKKFCEPRNYVYGYNPGHVSFYGP